MYNQTLKFFKKMRFNKEKFNLNFMNVRTKYMKNIKESIHKQSSINKHILDYAIKDACISYKSALTNIKNKNIKHFRLRYIKKTKKIKIIKLEKTMFSENHKTFCRSILGDKIKTTSGENFKEISTDCTLQCKYDRFILLVPVKIENNKKSKKIKRKKNKNIAIDIGIRNPFVGFSENHVINIGSNAQKRISTYLQQIDDINSSDKSTKIKSNATNKRYYKINNLVDELQWKTIKYLTDNYQTILVGNMSTANIVKNKLQSMTKRIAHLLKIYVFHERLKYKCYLANVKYRKVDERYTSKMCTFCGKINDTLGSKKIFVCDGCKSIIERDVGGARNIYIVDIVK